MKTGTRKLHNYEGKRLMRQAQHTKKTEYGLQIF